MFKGQSFLREASALLAIRYLFLPTQLLVQKGQSINSYLD